MSGCLKECVTDIPIYLVRGVANKGGSSLLQQVKEASHRFCMPHVHNMLTGAREVHYVTFFVTAVPASSSTQSEASCA